VVGQGLARCRSRAIQQADICKPDTQLQRDLLKPVTQLRARLLTSYPASYQALDLR